MINLVAFMDIETGLGMTLHADDERIVSNKELIWPMISALNTFVKECTSDRTGLTNATLHDIKIYLYTPILGSNWRYVFFADIFENNAYIAQKGKAIHNLLEPYLCTECFEAPEDLMDKVIDIITYSQHFDESCLKDETIETINKAIKKEEDENRMIVADLFIGDIDAGKVFSFIHRDNLIEKASTNLFAELLVAFSRDNDLWMSSSICEEEALRLPHIKETEKWREGWFLEKLGSKKSDFWLIGYFYYHEANEVGVRTLIDFICRQLEGSLQELDCFRPF